MPRNHSDAREVPVEEEVIDDDSNLLSFHSERPRRDHALKNYEDHVNQITKQDDQIKWPFTSKFIPDPIVDWSKPPIFDDEPFIDGTNDMFNHILSVGSINQSYGRVGVNFIFVEDHILGLHEFYEHSKLISNMRNIFYDPFEEKFHEKLTTLSLNRSNLGFDEDVLNLLKKFVPLIFEDSSLKFRFEKLNLKYKVDADKCRWAKLFRAIETRGRVFFKRGRMMQTEF
ncbi:hypothetical protein CsSME_00040763 [Camellia sinensis var. sinensis]